jgi:hypothetical protein
MISHFYMIAQTSNELHSWTSFLHVRSNNFAFLPEVGQKFYCRYDGLVEM